MHEQPDDLALQRLDDDGAPAPPVADLPSERRRLAEALLHPGESLDWQESRATVQQEL